MVSKWSSPRRRPFLDHFKTIFRVSSRAQRRIDPEPFFDHFLTMSFGPPLRPFFDHFPIMCPVGHVHLIILGPDPEAQAFRPGHFNWAYQISRAPKKGPTGNSWKNLQDLPQQSQNTQNPQRNPRPGTESSDSTPKASTGALRAPVGRGRRLRLCFLYFHWCFFKVFCRLSHNYQQTLPGFVYY